jgi:hypothetical protein
LGSLTLLRRFEDRGEPVARQRVTILLDESRVGAPAVAAALTRPGVKVFQEEYDRDETRTRVIFEVRASTVLDGNEIARGLDGVQGIKQIRIERL